MANRKYRDNSNFQEDAESDLVQIQTSLFAKEVMADPEFRAHFEDDMEKIKFAVCIAIKYGREPSVTDGSFRTSHNWANFDRDGRMAGLLARYKKSSTPARLVTELAETGFRIIKDKFNEGQTLRDLI